MKLCDFFEVTRQAYYKTLKYTERKQMQQEVIIEMVQSIRHRHRRMGGRKLYHLLKQDIQLDLRRGMGRDKFFDLLRSWKLLVRRGRKYALTTESRHRFRVYKNKMLEFKPHRPHQAWVCDITYVRMKKGFVYLFLITDAYSRKVVGWKLSKNLGIESGVQALKMAINQCPNTEGLIHHSDRGIQYCSNYYVETLKAKGIQISMAEAGNCYENAMAERVNGILKDEYGLEETFADQREALQAVKEAINAYNEERPHWALNLQIPSKVHEAA